MAPNSDVKSSPQDSPIIKNPITRWMILISSYTLIGLYFGLQSALKSLAGIERHHWFTNLSASMLFWYLWMVLTPVVFLLARRLRPDKGRRIFSAALHAVLALLVALAQTVLWVITSYLVFGEQFVAIEMPADIDFNVNILIHSFSSYYKYWLIIFIYYTFDYYRRLRDKEQESDQLQISAAELQSRLSQARLDALRTQLHPHFLFNTLNTISVLMKMLSGPMRCL